MDDPDVPTFPDALYTEQAAYLAEHTSLTEREAEAYLRRAHIPDDEKQNVLDRTLAKQMGVSKGTFSKHLNNALDKLEGEDAIIDSLTSLLLTTDIGGAGAPSRQVVAAKKTMNAFILITETEFYDAERYNFPSKYKAHLVYREQEPDIDFDEMPDDIIHYDKHSVFTVKSSGEGHFYESVLAYIDALSALDAYDLISAANLLEDDLGIHEQTDAASDILQDASGDVMEREGQ